VNKETEAEAGQLATQYLWHAGYDPRGFMYFYDKMVGDASHTHTASFFRTHPPSSDRALLSLAELVYLPAKARTTEDTPRFQRMHALAEAWVKAHPRVTSGAPAGCGTSTTN
jgi:predicted Zn-dependent protease